MPPGAPVFPPDDPFPLRQSPAASVTLTPLPPTTAAAGQTAPAGPTAAPSGPEGIQEATAPMRVSGGYALMDALHRHGVKHIFGYPGGAILPIYD